MEETRDDFAVEAEDSIDSDLDLAMRPNFNKTPADGGKLQENSLFSTVPTGRGDSKAMNKDSWVEGSSTQNQTAANWNKMENSLRTSVPQSQSIWPSSRAKPSSQESDAKLQSRFNRGKFVTSIDQETELKRKQAQ